MLSATKLKLFGLLALILLSATLLMPGSSSLTLVIPGASVLTPYPSPATYYPRPYQRTIREAVAEGKLTIYSTTDKEWAAGLLSKFRELYPEIAIEYNNLESANLHSRFLGEVHAGESTADFLWSSAMDLQIKLVNDGYAQAYVSPEKGNLPPWAVWKNEAWGITAEPIVFVYNKDLVPEDDIPKTHGDFTELLKNKPDYYSGRIAAYDPARSSAGFLYLTQDLENNRDTWSLVEALGSTKPTLYTSSVRMIEDVIAGRKLIGYNVIGSYALEKQTTNPALGVIAPGDYTLIMSRIAVIPKDAPHPNAAKLFLDLMLSKQGQDLLSRNFLGSIRSDVLSASPAAENNNAARAIRVGPALIANLDQVKRRSILKSWHDALEEAALGSEATGAE
ncbi:ABC transporter substrate-binding protein [Marinimicrobium alkaliphilum]|uniref:ABC transporter substrate-binding protein n=1 Tax=Marinimicrobium alkaliphilum TaxID=2202654 RepID=UPI0018E0AC97|nr:ABC transporter substrate-binding protein [Marinimicrobium alkaliphilum]